MTKLGKSASTKIGRFINRSLVYSSLAILDQAREKWRYEYDKEMGWPEDYIDNARNMVLDAVEQKNREVAGKMKALGVDCAIIAQGTGLTIDEVEAL